jgi:hypothetical protein
MIPVLLSVCFFMRPICDLDDPMKSQPCRSTHGLSPIIYLERPGKMGFFCFFPEIPSNIIQIKHPKVDRFGGRRLPPVLSDLIEKLLFLAASQFANIFSGRSLLLVSLLLLTDL